MSEQLKPCPMCLDGGKPWMRNRFDEDGCLWTNVECLSCGLKTRGKWVSHSSDTCPIFYAEVRDEWNTRASQPALAQGDVVPAGLTQFLMETLQAFDTDDERFGDDAWGEKCRGFVQALSAQPAAVAVAVAVEREPSAFDTLPDDFETGDY